MAVKRTVEIALKWGHATLSDGSFFLRDLFPCVVSECHFSHVLSPNLFLPVLSSTIVLSVFQWFPPSSKLW